MPNTRHFLVWFIPVLSFGSGYGFSYAVTWIRKRFIIHQNLTQEMNKEEKLEMIPNSPSTTSSIHLSDLPESLLIHIITFLAISDLGTFASVNKHWKRMSEDPYFWKSLFERDFFSLAYSEEYFWKKYYKDWYNALDWDALMICCCTTGVIGRYFDIGYENCDWSHWQEDYDTTSPMYTAILYHKHHVVKRLIDKGVRCDDYLYQACKSQNIDTVRVLLESGIDPEYIRDPYESPLHVAVKNGAIPVVSLLLEYGWDIDQVTDSIAITALHLAVAQNNEELAMLLLELGADPNRVVPEYISATPFEENSPFGVMGDTESVTNLLIEYGAQLDTAQYYWFGYPQI